METVVIALGGNAIIRPGEEGTVPQQFSNTRRTVEAIAPYLTRGCPLVITHGNGPQVGNIVIRVEEALHKAYEVPLGVCVAESQGEMGYMIAQTVGNKLRNLGQDRNVVSILTQSVVSPRDPQLTEPTKPIGPFYTEGEMNRLRHRGINVVEDSGRGYRRVVPSPRPLETVEREVISRLSKDGTVVIAAGGGGMPVYLDAEGNLEGIDAVVDKDLASSVLALELGAREFVILTGLSHVCVDFGTDRERPLAEVTAARLTTLHREGQFPPGSMGPKVEAALHFLAHGGNQAIITSVSGITRWLAGEKDAATVISNSPSSEAPGVPSQPESPSEP